MPPRSREERLFGAACLKLTLEKSLGDGTAGAEIYRSTLIDLDLTDADVDEYLQKHRADVESALKRRGRNGG